MAACEVPPLGTVEMPFSTNTLRGADSATLSLACGSIPRWNGRETRSDAVARPRAGRVTPHVSK